MKCGFHLCVSLFLNRQRTYFTFFFFFLDKHHFNNQRKKKQNKKNNAMSTRTFWLKFMIPNFFVQYTRAVQKLHGLVL